MSNLGLFDREEVDADKARRRSLSEVAVARSNAVIDARAQEIVLFFRLGTRPRNASRATIRASRKISCSR